jgi:hypothetical protein
MRHSLYVLLLIVTLSASGTAAAQDSHYWTNAYGTRGQLVGGVVIGSIVDLSSTFYNPGAISKTSDTNLIITTSAFQLTAITVEDVFWGNQNLQTWQFGTAPDIFAFRFTRRERKNQFTFSYLTRYDTRLNDNIYQIDQRDVLDWAGGGLDDFTGTYNGEHRVYEGWGGLSWSRSLSDSVGIGVTQYIAVRDHDGVFHTTAQAVNPDTEEGGNALFMDRYSYWHVRLLWKAGVLFDYNPLTFGFSLTTPSIGLFGKGYAFYDRSIINLDITGDGSPESSLASNYQDDVGVNYRSPLSIGAGMSWRLGGEMGTSIIHLSMEWFSGLGEYTVIDTADFTAQTSGETISNDYTLELSPVLNWGIGFEQIFSETFTMYGSFIRDGSALSQSTDSRLALSSYDLYHISWGSAFYIFGFQITFGLGYGFGNTSDYILSPTGDLQGDNITTPEPVQATYRYRRLLLLIGFAFDL